MSLLLFLKDYLLENKLIPPYKNTIFGYDTKWNIFGKYEYLFSEKANILF